jgi:multidrug efflux system outer membrane protein
VRSKSRPLSIGLIGLVFVLSACAISPRYKRPAIDAPNAFRSQEEGVGQKEALTDLPWWKVFNDGTLEELVKKAYQNNYDLRIAASRIKQARAVTVQTRSLWGPQVEFDGDLARGRNSFLNNPSYTGGKTASSMLIAMNATWEVDLWGKIWKMNEASRAQYLASREAERGVMLSLYSSVAQAYFELLELDLELQIAKRTKQSFADSLKIFEQRLIGGVASKLETSRAEAALAQAAASIPDLERQITIKENQISILLGEDPGAIARNVALLNIQTPPQVPAGIPATVLERRPDIREAEQNLRAANAEVGVAIADFFPKVGLTMLLGRVSPELSLMSAGTANMWALAGSTVAPLFQSGKLIGQYQQYKAQWQEAKLQYEQTALTAFQEVSNALITRQKLKGVRTEQARAVKALQEAVKIATERYLAGKASYYEVLEAQQQLFPAENNLAKTDLNQLLVIVQLYKALGGGWQVESSK